MKKILLCLICSLFLEHGVMAIANDNDTLQWITNVSQIIENATPNETSQFDWESIWEVNEWQRVEYMPQPGNYEYFHKQLEQIQISKNQIEIEGYSILLNGYTKSLIEIKHQQVDGIYGEKEYVSGKLALINNELYLHLRITGTQDYAVDLYAVGVRTTISIEPLQATTWHCVSVYRTVFDDDNVSFSPATYRLQGDTIFGDTRYKTLRSENGTYWGAVRKTDDGQQVYYRPGEGTGKFPASLGKEYLLYDFSVKEGDTVVAYNGFMDTSIEEGTPDPYNPPLDTMVVVSVNVIDGRKHVQILMLNYLNLHFTQEVEWIEGIGTRNILFCYDRNFLPGNNYGLYTLCAADSEGNVLYSFDTDYLGIHNNQCQLEPLAIENVHTDSSSASKLLREGQLIIERDGKMFNTIGQIVQ